MNEPAAFDDRRHRSGADANDVDGIAADDYEVCGLAVLEASLGAVVLLLVVNLIQRLVS